MQHALKRTVMTVLLACALLGAVAVAVFGLGRDLSAAPVSETTSGKMTWYDDVGPSACGPGINAVTEDLVAVSHELFTSANPNNDNLCKGVSIEVTYNGKTLTLPVKDKCMGCTREQIDLSKSAFQKLEPNLDLGVVPVTWKFVNDGGNGSGGGGGGDTQAPSAPANLRSASQTPTSVSLAWDASNDNAYVTGYDIYDGSSKVTTVTDTSATLNDLPADSAHDYTVKARDAAGNESAASNGIHVTIARTGAENGDCPAAWSSTRSYVPGDVVSFAGHKFRATFYSTDAVPDNPASWAVWHDDGACG